MFSNTSPSRGPRKVGFGTRLPPGGAAPPPAPPAGRAHDSPVPSPASDEPLSFAYDGRFGEALRLVLANLALTVVTLGVYRFWAKTRYRQYIWSRVRMQDEPFEYTGRGIHLFVGFAFVLFVVLPVITASNYGIELLIAQNPALGLMASFALLGGIFVLAQAGVYQARRYRMSHSAWRGIRFGQAGSAFGYAFLAAGCLVLAMFSGGILTPWMETRLAAVRWHKTRFGDRAFTFETTSVPLIGRWVLALLLVVPTLGLSIVWYRVWQLRYYVAAVEFEGVRFSSGLRTGQVLRIAVVTFVALGLLAAPIVLAFGASMWPLLEAMGQTPPDAAPPNEAVALVFGLILTILIGGSAVVQAYAVPALLRRFFDSLETSGTVDFAAIAQSSDTAPRRGEGLAAMFDVGGSI